MSGHRIAARAGDLPPSALHVVHHEVEERRRGGRRVIALHVGEPAFRPPAGVPRAVAAAVAEGRTGYTEAEGLPALRERLAAKIRRRNGFAAVPAQILVTPGSTQGLLSTLLTTCEPGDEVLLPEIHWPIYGHAAGVAGLRVRCYPLGPGMRLDGERLVAAASGATRLVVVNSPANPTGAVAGRGELSAVVRAAHRRGWWMVSDEAYEDFVYSGRHASPAAIEQELGDDRRIFSVFTFSKSHAMTGYRLGYVAAPTTGMAAAVARVQAGSILAPSAPVQHGALAAVDDDAGPAAARAAIMRTRTAGLAPLAADGSLEALPAGGWYALLDISRSGMDSAGFCRRLLETAEVAVAPGHAFVQAGRPDPGIVRVAFCGDRAEVVEGVARLREFLDGRTAPPAAGSRIALGGGGR